MIEKTELEDDAKEKISLMVEHRLPWLLIGLIGGIGATILASRFEELLSKNIQLTFFIPVIVYMAAAFGSQTENVYVRNMGREKVKLSQYMFKELVLGLVLGALLGAIIGVFTYFWFGVLQTALSVSLAMFLTMAISPVVALSVPAILQKRHSDPALGSGPFVTIIQDVLSLLIYFSVSLLIISI